MSDLMITSALKTEIVIFRKYNLYSQNTHQYILRVSVFKFMIQIANKIINMYKRLFDLVCEKI